MFSVPYPAIVSALYDGAKYIIPIDTVGKAAEISEEIEGIAAGERDGKLGDGLSHGNSPLEYTKEFIESKILPP